MNISRSVLLATLVGTVVVVSACTREAVDDTTNTAEESVDTTLDAISNGATGAVDGTKEIAGAVADTSRDVASATGEAITDAWITTALNATFVDEALLEDSDINVDTDDHVVTLKGTVTSAEAKARAAAIAHDTRGVTRVVNQLVVR
jgi:osmotically-inducible protein OsmY